MKIEFVLDYRSNYSYLANTRVKRYRSHVDYTPVDIADVMKRVNNQPSPLCPPKAHYAAIDGLRWAKRYGVGFSPNAALLQAMRAGQFDGKLPLRAALAAQDLGVFPAVNDALFEAFWVGRDDLTTDDGRMAFLKDHGIDAPDLWRLADDRSIRDRLAQQSQHAAERGVFGAPTFFAGAEMFFGNDRLEFVEAILQESKAAWSGRMSKRVAVVTGVGPGTGLSIVRRLAEGGYDVAMIARNQDRLRQYEASIRGTRAFAADVTDTRQFDAALDDVATIFGAPQLVVHNAVGGAFGNFLQIDPAVLEHNFQTNVMALLQVARRVAPAMIDAGSGTIIATGNTSALRGKGNFAGFAPTKAAQRILAESIARELGPKGVHVAYLVIDGVIDLEWTRKLRPNEPDDFFIKPSDIADEVWHLAHQPRGAWSFNAELRPYREAW